MSRFFQENDISIPDVAHEPAFSHQSFCVASGQLKFFFVHSPSGLELYD